MAAHLHEAAIVATILADEDRLHRGLHVVVDAAAAGALEQSERPVVGVEHHLLRLAWIGASEQHPAVTEPDMSDLHDHRHAMQQDNLMAPVELGRLLPVQSSAGHRPPGVNFGRRSPGSGGQYCRPNNKLRILRELADLRARQAASEAVLNQIASVVLYGLPDPMGAVAALKQGSRFTVESTDQADANTMRLVLDWDVARMVDIIQ